MNNNPDSIRLQTRESILTAIVDLMEDTPMTELTVKEVVYQAGVGRRTFYSYFSSMEDAVNKCVHEMNESIIGELFGLSEICHELIGSILFRHWDENRRMLRVFFADPRINMYEIFMDFISYLRSRIEESFPRRGANHTGYLNHFISGGLFNILGHWVSSDEETSREEMIQLFVALMDSLKVLIDESEQN